MCTHACVAKQEEKPEGEMEEGEEEEEEGAERTHARAVAADDKRSCSGR